MAVSSENKIVLKGKGHYEEGYLDTVATPGMHVQMAADGDYDMSPAAIAELSKENVILVVEDSLQGKTKTDAYAANDRVFLYIPVPGDVVLLFVKSGQNIAVGDKLVQEGGGTGLWVEAAGTETRYKFQALESSGGALGANGHIKARCML